MSMARSLVLPRDIVGVAVGPLAHDIDARWLMAYAAGLGETDARYFETRGTAGPAAKTFAVGSVVYAVAVSADRRRR